MAGTMVSIVISIFLGALIAIATLAVTILLCVWTYRDANSKGLSGILWTLVVLLVPSCIGLIIYLIVRTDYKKVTCSKCMKQVNGKSKFCSNCGDELVPMVEVSEDDEKFRKSQKHILIGFFSTLGGIVVAAILMVAFMLTGVVDAIGTGARYISEIDSGALSEDLRDLDTLLSKEGIKLHVDDKKVVIMDENDNELIYVDKETDEVKVDVKAIKELMDKYGIEYDPDMTEQEIEESIDEMFDDIDEMNDKIDDWSEHK